MVETESNKRVRSAVALETEEKNGAELLEDILHRNNLNAAWKKVKDNKGAAGIDGMSVDEMLPYLKEHREELLESIRGGFYKPKPVRRVEISKPDGGVRMLGVPTVIDRMIQQAIAQVLEPIFEKTFSDNSYGFRPGRNAHQAIKQARRYYDEGYTRVVDIDLAKYFDTVNHDLLMDMLREQVRDKRVLTLIRKFLKSGIMINGLVNASQEGTPQGGNLSPLLSNIYLTRFDKMLEERGHKFVRYADDCNIYVKSKRAAERVMENSVEYLEGKLKLEVNRKKSSTGSPLRLKFLGFSLYKMGKKTGIRPHNKSWERFKNKLRELTSRKQGRSIEIILLKVRRYTIGWLAYYSISDMRNRIQKINEWLRRRIRQIFWKQWKKISAKFRNLQRLGIPKGKAWEWSNSRLGYWRISGSWILSTSLTNKYLESIGYDDISKRYEALHCA
ncbi:group II intron reverse transcriptase/maturase [Sedimentibacter sp.]|jgi:Retron-type reverse transcriptase|uniref:group II intron reverse transcriptase/maturase n=1 Tax=Sedimentibacter sp. TaxID=1960295 RepID=UPI002898CC3A|nr:group II intron reverse transcriptase/maturase [Sedimentibacter sp.]